MLSRGSSLSILRPRISSRHAARTHKQCFSPLSHTSNIKLHFRQFSVSSLSSIFRFGPEGRSHKIGSGLRSFHSSDRLFSKRDHYEVLGLQKNADKKQIKTAFYKLAKKFHPDQNKDDANAAEKFAEVQNAYECLSDDEKRQAYDMFGHDAEQMGGAGAGGPGGMGADFDLRDIFGFGGGFGGFGGGNTGGFQNRAQRGADLQVKVQLPFMEAVNGCKRSLSVQSLGTCNECDGTGDKKGTTPVTCQTCNGSGMIHQKHGPFHIQVGCPQCDGEGQTRQSCRPCNGRGVVRETRNVTVNIPAGVDSDTNLRLVNQGNAGAHGGSRGHLWVKVEVLPHSDFKRDNADIYVDAKLDLVTAILGGSITVPSLKGSASVKVDPGTQPGDKRVMRNKGIKVLNRNAYGHQYITFKVEIPRTLTDRQRKALAMFASEEDEEDRYESNDDDVDHGNINYDSEDNSSDNDSDVKDSKGGFFSRIKDTFCNEEDKEGADKANQDSK